MSTAWLVTWLVGGLCAAAAAAILAALFRFNAATRYAAWWIAMAAVTCFAWLFLPASADIAAAPPEPLVYVDAVPDTFFSVTVGLWLAIALIRLLRLVPSLHAVYAVRDRCRACPAHIEAQLPLWQTAKTRGRAVELVISDEVRSATVLGFQQPCIALPPHVVEVLTVAELDNVVLHEYAHVQRRDDWARLAQALVQSVLWIHPAVALIGRRLDREREMACDEWVVAFTGHAKTYAHALARAAEAISATRPAPALMPGLFGGRHDLVRRIDRLLGMRGKVQCAISAAGVAAAVAAVAAIGGLRVVPLVGEIGEIAAPLAAVKPLRLLPPMTRRQPDGEISLRAAAPRPRRIGRRPQSGERTPTPAAPAATVHAATLEIVTTTPEGQAELLAARAIPGSYTTDAPPVQPPDHPGTWSRIGTAAAQFGVGAGKKGASFGGVFSRAGTSLARSF